MKTKPVPRKHAKAKPKTATRPSAKGPAPSSEPQRKQLPLPRPPPFRCRGHVLVYRTQAESPAMAALVATLPRVTQSPEFIVLSAPPQPVTPGAATPLSDEQLVAQFAAFESKADPAAHAAQEALADLDARGETFALGALARQALAALATKARAGDGQALYHFGAIAVETCEALSQFAAAKPAALKPLAQELLRWPLMRSRNPRNSDPEATLDALDLGAATPVRADRFTKWKADAAGQIAADLLDFLRANFAPEPPLNADNCARWWAVAKQAFLRTYPDPAAVADLRALVTTPTRRLSPGRTREAITSMIGARFRAMLMAYHS
ncbi:MAG: hypothetical protein HS113_20565 [Verrucomicrobiales bacterium]|nr:hypothetical protein [Verrucomicrobiales bacterium]